VSVTKYQSRFKIQLDLFYLNGPVLKLSRKRINPRPYAESQDINQQKRANKQKKAAIFNNL